MRRLYRAGMAAIATAVICEATPAGAQGRDRLDGSEN